MTIFFFLGGGGGGGGGVVLIWPVWGTKIFHLSCDRAKGYYPITLISATHLLAFVLILKKRIVVYLTIVKVRANSNWCDGGVEDALLKLSC